MNKMKEHNKVRREFEGDHEEMNNLANRYYNGEGVEKDFEKDFEESI